MHLDSPHLCDDRFIKHVKPIDCSSSSLSSATSGSHTDDNFDKKKLNTKTMILIELTNFQILLFQILK